MYATTDIFPHEQLWNTIWVTIIIAVAFTGLYCLYCITGIDESEEEEAEDDEKTEEEKNKE